jgi:hypothetical protein
MSSIYTCECGNQSKKKNYHKSQQHIKSKTHQKYIQSNQEEEKQYTPEYYSPIQPIISEIAEPIIQPIISEIAEPIIQPIISEIAEPIIQPSIKHTESKSIFDRCWTQQRIEKLYDAEEMDINDLMYTRMEHYDFVKREYYCYCGFSHKSHDIVMNSKRHQYSKKHLLYAWSVYSNQLDKLNEYVELKEFDTMIENNNIRPYNIYANDAKYTNEGYIENEIIDHIVIDGVKIYHDRPQERNGGTLLNFKCQCDYDLETHTNNTTFKILNGVSLDTAMGSNHLYEPNLVNMIQSFLPEVSFQKNVLFDHIKHHHINIKSNILKYNHIIHEMSTILIRYIEKFIADDKIYKSPHYLKVINYIQGNGNNLFLNKIFYNYKYYN